MFIHYFKLVVVFRRLVGVLIRCLLIWVAILLLNFLRGPPNSYPFIIVGI